MAETTQFRFDATNPAAQRWAKQYGASMVREVSAETKAALRVLVARAIREGIPPYDMARLIVGTEQHPGMIGLTTRQMQAVLNHRTMLIDSGLSLPKVDQQIGRLIKRKIKLRSVTIARTETMKALNGGTKASWIQAQKEGFLAKDAQKEWITTGFGACVICDGLDGQLTPLNETWGGLVPPAHPSCRCTVGFAPGEARSP